MVLCETYREADSASAGWPVSRGSFQNRRWGSDQNRDGREGFGRPVEKMSKSRKNVVDPEAIIDSYGADTARLFMLSDSPAAQDLEWTEAGIDGAWRYTNRCGGFWRNRSFHSGFCRYGGAGYCLAGGRRSFAEDPSDDRGCQRGSGRLSI